MARSPSYPGITLEEALDRARALYQHERRNAVPIDTVLEHWGYRPGTGIGRITLSALRKFGLLQNDGPLERRQVRLSDLALRILLDEREDSSERLGAIQQAALLPTIHTELWDKYGADLPSDANLGYFLRVERRFTDSGAEELIREYRETLAFARLSGTAIVPSYGTATQPPPQSATLGRAGMTVTAHPISRRAEAPDLQGAGVGHSASASVQTLTVPIGGGRFAHLAMPYPMSEADWKQFEAVLTAMKPGIVDPVAEAPALSASEEDDGQPKVD